MELVAPLRFFTGADLASAGGKGANLAALLNAGFPVPDGFVVTTRAYAEAVRSAGLAVPDLAVPDLAVPDLAVPDLAVPDEAFDSCPDSARLRAGFDQLTLPGAVAAAIETGYTALGGGPVAVRSSATAEDLPGASFAGQQDTFLNVTGVPAVLAAVRRCWGSLWTDRAIAYRRRLGLGPGRIRIAVVVQVMIDATVAGVVFTADPVTGRRDRIVVDAARGLGQAVVSGQVTPDHYVLGRRGQVLEYPPAPAGPVPRPVLRTLARLGDQVERHFGRPQDIEWASTSDRVWLLQARPITALPPPPVRLDGFQRRIAALLLEYLPYRPYPIDMTTWLARGPARLMGQVTGYFGVQVRFEGCLSEVDGVVDRLVPPTPRPTLRALLAPIRIVRLAVRYDPSRWTGDPRFVDFRCQAGRLAAEDLARLPWPKLIEVAEGALELIQPVADLRISYLPRSGLALLRLWLVLIVLRRTSLMKDLISGAPTRTSQANRALADLAALVRADPPLHAAVEDLDLARLPSFGDFHRRFQAFLAEYGHRECVTPLLVTAPTWQDRPETVLGLISVLTQDPPLPAQRCRAAIARLLEHPVLRRSGPVWRTAVERWVNQARAGIAFREDSHFYFTQPLAILRRCLFELGRRLTAANLLADPAEVVHLRWAELCRMAEPGSLAAAEPERIRALVRLRGERRRERANLPLLDPRLVFRSRPAGLAMVTGTPAAGGVATGPVTVVREPADFPKLSRGDVLVCPYTNPSWTPLFQRAAAVVADTGGLGSHAAVVAREYGIPAVMGTSNGTSVLTDGVIVTVDGTAGRVLAAPR